MLQKSTPTWTCQFPISVAVEGKDCFKAIADMGLTHTAFCCMIYSPYRLVLPRYPSRGIYSMEEGLYFYQPEAKRYRDLPLAPLPSVDFAGRDLLRETVDGARAAGLKTCAWITTFANGRTAKLHPDWAVQNLYGSRDRLFLDFDHPEVREFSLRVCEEIAERYEVDEIMLDKIPQLCLEAASLAGRIDPVLRTVGSFCFSSHAKKAAAKRGLDLERVHKDCMKLANESLAIPPHVTANLAADLTGDNETTLLLLDHPWLIDVLKDRIASIKQYMAEVRQRIDAKRRGIKLTAAFVPPVKPGHAASTPRPWLAAQSYAAYKDSALDMIHCVIHWGADTVQYDTTRAVDAVRGSKLKICTHVKAYGTTRPDEIHQLADAALRGGAEGLAFFCYDLYSQQMIDAITKLNA